GPGGSWGAPCRGCGVLPWLSGSGLIGAPGRAGGLGGGTAGDSSAAMTATTAPTGASMPSPPLISASVPATVAGTSIDVLSVSISNRSSPGRILSPTFLNQLVILPELTVSP